MMVDLEGNDTLTKERYLADPCKATLSSPFMMQLHRLYIKAARKRQGIGTRLLHTVELYLREQGKTAAHVHLGGKEYFESRSFYPKHGYREYAPSMMKKEL